MELELLLIFSGLYSLIIFSVYKIVKLEKKVSSAGKPQKYEPFITVWKLVKQLIFGVASLILVEFVSKYLVTLQPLNSSALIVFLMASFNALLNFVKNR
jgi:hypothetical protein